MWEIIKLEWETLIKGLVITFLLVFPFTFIPTLIAHGFSGEALLRRVPTSTLYSLGIAVLVMSFVVYDNYRKLLRKKQLYDKPAFTALDFYGRIGGIGSLVEGLSTFLVGKWKLYYFKIEIDIPDAHQEAFIIKIYPVLAAVVEFRDNEEERQKIAEGLDLQLDEWNIPYLHARVTEEELNDRNLFRTILDHLEVKLIENDFKPFALDESRL